MDDEEDVKKIADIIDNWKVGLISAEQVMNSISQIVLGDF
jgi:hypothetical protein